MALEDDDLPVLNDVVRSGDESIIQSTRLEREGGDRPDSDSTAPLHFELPAHLQLDNLIYDIDLDETLELDEHGDTYFENQQNEPVSRPSRADHVAGEGLTSLNNSIASNESHTPGNHTDEQLELLIDEIIDRHIASLRTDLRNLLQRARDLP